MKFEFIVDHAARLDRFVATQLPFIRRAFLQKQFRQKEIKVNGRLEKPETKIMVGARVDVFLPEPRRNFGLLSGCEILFEDKDVIAFDKRANITSVPGVGTRGDTLIESAEKLLNLKLIAVHRLDRDTSGVIIFAKHAKIARELEAEFRTRRTEKTYYALTRTPATESGIIKTPLLERGEKMVVDPRGVNAETQWQIVKNYGQYALLEVHPKTGRKHQIRVHLASIGAPILGDQTYGEKNSKFTRHLLHAGELRILNYKITAKLPKEFDVGVGN